MEDQQDLAKIQLQGLIELKAECEEKFLLVKKRIDDAIEDVTEKCYQYMQTEEEKIRILNPVGKKPIMEVPWTKSFLEEIQSRIALYIEHFLKSEKVTCIFEDIKNGNVTFYKNASKNISTMAAQWTDGHGERSEANDFDEEDDLAIYLEIPLIIVAVVVTVIAAAIALVLSPILAPVVFIFYSAEKKKALKREFINKAYSTYMLSIRGQIKDHLDKSSGDALKLLSDKMLNHSLPNRINHLEKLIQNLEQSREKILVNTESFRDLAKKVEAMRMSASEL